MRRLTQLRSGSDADDADGVGAAGALARRRRHDRDELALADDAARRATRAATSSSRASPVACRRDRERPHAPHEAEPAEHLGLLASCRRSAPTGGTRRRGARSCRSASGTRSRRRRDLRPPAPPRARPPTRRGRRRSRRPHPAGVVRARGQPSAASATSLIVRTVSAGYAPTAVSSESIERVGAVEHRVGDVVHLGARRQRRARSSTRASASR